MFLFHDLLSHAELLKRKPAVTEPAGPGAEARQAARRQRCGQVTLYPVVTRQEPSDAMTEQPRVAAAISNVSSTGVGLVHSEKLSEGLEFDIRWDIGGRVVPVRLQVVHCRPMSAGVFRTGARLVSGVIPQEPELRIIAGPVEEVIDSTACDVVSEADMCIDPSISMDMLQIDSDPVAEPIADAAQSTWLEAQPEAQPDSQPESGTMPGVLRFEPVPAQPSLEATPTPAPPGTFKMANAFGFDKTEKLEGFTTCGFERSIELRREGARLYLYIHSPGKKNGWGIFVDPTEFESAFSRVQSAAKSPFITTLAA